MPSKSMFWDEAQLKHKQRTLIQNYSSVQPEVELVKLANLDRDIGSVTACMFFNVVDQQRCSQ